MNISDNCYIVELYRYIYIFKCYIIKHVKVIYTTCSWNSVYQQVLTKAAEKLKKGKGKDSTPQSAKKRKIGEKKEGKNFSLSLFFCLLSKSKQYLNTNISLHAWSYHAAVFKNVLVYALFKHACEVLTGLWSI